MSRSALSLTQAALLVEGVLVYAGRRAQDSVRGTREAEQRDDAASVEVPTAAASTSC